MNLLLIVLSLAGIAATQAEWLVKKPTDFQDMHTQCTKESEITSEQLEKIKSMEFPDEEQVRKYVLCAVTRLEVFCELEGYHADRLAAQFDVGLGEDETNTILETCIDKNEVKSTADVWAYRVQQCVLNSKIGERLKTAVKQDREKREGAVQQ